MVFSVEDTSFTNFNLVVDAYTDHSAEIQNSVRVEGYTHCKLDSGAHDCSSAAVSALKLGIWLADRTWHLSAILL